MNRGVILDAQNPGVRVQVLVQRDLEHRSASLPVMRKKISIPARLWKRVALLTD